MIVQRNACDDATLRWPYRNEGMLMPKAEEIGPFDWLGWRTEICCWARLMLRRYPKIL